MKVRIIEALFFEDWEVVVDIDGVSYDIFNFNEEEDANRLADNVRKLLSKIEDKNKEEVVNADSYNRGSRFMSTS